MTKMNEKLARKIVYERSGGICEKCGWGRATNWHHRRAAGRVWAPENGLHLCGSGTTGCHGWITEHPEISRAHGWSVSNYADPGTTPAHLWFGWRLLTPDGGVLYVPSPAGGLLS
jgi:hypothetical protein